MITLVIPTYNERENLESLVRRIHGALGEEPYEVLIVDDDSPDGTGLLAEELAAGSYPIRVIHRKQRDGLASAVLEGLKVARGEILGFMDADLSHPPESLLHMKGLIEKRSADIVIGSRFVEGGGIEESWSKWRWITSFVARMLARPLTRVHDRTSGYFLFRKDVMGGVRLTPIGYKIGLELLVKGRYQRVEEVPIQFSDRHSGSSKMTLGIQFAYLVHLGFLYVHKVRSKLFSGFRRK